MSRRTVVSGLAWSVPAIVIASAAPAVAASTAPVIIAGQGAASIPQTVAGGSQASYTGWTPRSNVYVGSSTLAGFACGGDPSSGTADTVVTATYSFPVTSGGLYTILFDCMANFGSPVGNAQRQNLVVSVSPAGTANSFPVRVALAHGTQTPTYSTANTDAAWGGRGYALQAASQTAKATYSATYKAGATTTVTMTFTFTMLSNSGTSLSVWDDVWISQPIVQKIG